MKRWWRDPLVAFLAAGGAVFAAERLLGGDEENVIVVTRGVERQLLDQWTTQMGRPPTTVEAEGLVDQWLREEVYYREALKMGLDDNDTIIRRRLAQKLTFINEDLANATPPTRDALEAYFDEHRESYRQPARFSFEHRYFSSDRRADAEGDARRALADPALRDDPFMLQKRYAGRSLREVGDLFGSAFADALAALDAAATADASWAGPIRSAYGWHLVRMTERQPARQPALDEVRDAVIRDYRASRRGDANAALYEALRSKYEIRWEDDGSEAKTAGAVGDS